MEAPVTLLLNFLPDQVYDTICGSSDRDLKGQFITYVTYPKRTAGVFANHLDQRAYRLSAGGTVHQNLEYYTRATVIFAALAQPRISNLRSCDPLYVNCDRHPV